MNTHTEKPKSPGTGLIRISIIILLQSLRRLGGSNMLRQAPFWHGTLHCYCFILYLNHIVSRECQNKRLSFFLSQYQFLNQYIRMCIFNSQFEVIYTVTLRQRLYMRNLMILYLQYLVGSIQNMCVYQSYWILKVFSFCFRYSYETLQETANFLLSRISETPSIGVICGSGMGSYWKEGIYYFAFTIQNKQREIYVE